MAAPAEASFFTKRRRDSPSHRAIKDRVSVGVRSAVARAMALRLAAICAMADEGGNAVESGSEYGGKRQLRVRASMEAIWKRFASGGMP
jgi:hypothetical protein